MNARFAPLVKCHVKTNAPGLLFDLLERSTFARSRLKIKSHLLAPCLRCALFPRTFTVLPPTNMHRVISLGLLDEDAKTAKHGVLSLDRAVEGALSLFARLWSLSTDDSLLSATLDNFYHGCGALSGAVKLGPRPVARPCQA